MDPNTALAELIGALNQGNCDKALDRLEGLTAWLAAGGFQPDWREAKKICGDILKARGL